MNRTGRILIFSFLFMAYAAYSALIYTGNGEPAIPPQAQETAIRGKMLWQKHNCQSCHQLYGLGGYLGPDLTDCYSAPNKGPAYMDVILQYGVGVMPDFKLTATEREELVTFLRCVDASGNADPKKFTTTITGNIYPYAAK